MAEHFTHQEAAKIVQAAVESGQVKLIGNNHADTGNSNAKAIARATTDAAYLVTLLTKLQEAPAVPPNVEMPKPN